MNRRNRGFTLVETIIALLLSVIILNMGLKLAINYYKNYTEALNVNLINDDIDDALMSIDILLNSTMIKDISVIEDSNYKRGDISIIYAVDHFDNSEEKKKRILFEKSTEKIILETTKINKNNIESYGKNVILKNVEDFSILKKGNIFYLKIIHKSGEERIKCI